MHEQERATVCIIPTAATENWWLYVHIYINILKCYSYYTDTGSKTNEIYSYHGDKDKQKCEKN